jgi:hypothetical protein
LPVVHLVPSVPTHASPGFFLGLQTFVVSQYVLVEHSPSVWQVVRQPVVIEHWYWPQSVLLPGLQTPKPSHMLAGVKVALLQDAVPQVLLLSTFWQAPVPSQLPVFPQALVAVSSWQLLYGSLPATTDAQVPSATLVSFFLHELHVPAHLLLQHIPSTQLPNVHSLSAAHVFPLSFCAVQVLVVVSQ